MMNSNVGADARPGAPSPLVTTTRPISFTGPAQLLSEAPRRRIPIAGTIYPGTKVLTKATSASARFKEIYAEGIAAGRSFEQIEGDLVAAGAGDNPLRMLNLPFFRIRGADFVDPANADKMLEMYGEDMAERSGKLVRRVRRFPVMFPTDDESIVIPHSLMSYRASTLRYFSKEERGQRKCMLLGAMPAGTRAFGGRPELENPERPVCDPNRCPEYQSNNCNLTGAFQFYVPGIVGSGLLRVPTRSFYSISEALTQMRLVRQLRGSIAGLVDGKPFFHLSRELREVSWLAPEGPRRIQQYLIVLTADLDMVQMAAGQRQAALPPPSVEPAPPALMQVTHLAKLLDLDEECLDAIAGNPAWRQQPTAVAAMQEKLAAAASQSGGAEALRERAAIIIEGSQP